MTVEPTYTLKVNGEDREILMSYGLLKAIVRAIGEMERVALITLDMDLRDAVMGELLAERTKSGKKTTPVDLDDLDIDIAESTKLLEWTANHVTDFFVTSGQAMARIAKSQNERVEQVLSSVVGSKT